MSGTATTARFPVATLHCFSLSDYTSTWQYNSVLNSCRNKLSIILRGVYRVTTTCKSKIQFFSLLVHALIAVPLHSHPATPYTFFSVLLFYSLCHFLALSFAPSLYYSLSLFLSLPMYRFQYPQTLNHCHSVSVSHPIFLFNGQHWIYFSAMGFAPYFPFPA